MPCLLTFFLLLAFTFWSVGAWARRSARRARARQGLQELAKYFRGQLVSRGWFAEPDALFRHGEAQVRVGWTNDAPMSHDGQRLDARVRSRRGLAVSIGGVESAVDFVLAPNGCLAGADAGQGWSESSRTQGRREGLPVERWPDAPPSAAAELLERFEIRTTSQPELAALLTPGVGWSLRRLEESNPAGAWQVRLMARRLEVTKSCAVAHGDGPVRFVLGVLDLYDQLQVACATGIVFPDREEAKVLEEVRCRICGEGIVDQMVVCGKCRTPHHRDCWEYVGKCSVFGCGEMAYEWPGSASANSR